MSTLSFDDATFLAKAEELVDILCDLDAYDRPKKKLPNCPRCGEDELGVIHANWLLCYSCRWEMVASPKGDACPQS